MDVIEFVNSEGLSNLINSGNALVSGMTAAEAQAALNAAENSSMYIYNTLSTLGANATINFPNAANATEAIGDFISGGGATTISNAATSVGGSTETANMALIEGTGGTVGVAGLLSVGLPTAAAAIAPAAGVALGAGLYSLAPDFWESVSRTLLPFCYDDSELMPVVVDENGNTYLPAEAIEAFRELLAAYSGGGVIVPEDNPYNVPEFASCIYSGRAYRGDAPDVGQDFSNANLIPTPSNHAIWFSADSSSGTAFTYNDKTVYWSYITLNQITWNPTLPFLNQSTLLDDYHYQPMIAWVAQYGGYDTQPYPEGVSEWNGNAYPTNPTPINVINNIDTTTGNVTTNPYYPISMPIGDPGVTNDPSVNPDPTTNPEIAPAIDPYISPVPDPSKYPTSVNVPDPAPIPNPVPLNQPVINPNVNPSLEPVTESPANPSEPSTPTSSGNSVLPTLPLVPLIPSSSDASLFHVYNPTQGQIDSFGGWLWQSWIDTLFDDLSRWFNNPLDAVIGLQQFYGTPNISGSGTIKCGYLDSHVPSAIVGNRYSSINCGSIVIPEFYGNYLDYSPYTQVIVYLPFIGFMSLNADDIIGNAVSIIYHVDSYTGSCIAIITVARDGYQSVVYQFEGNCSIEIPLSGGQQSTLKSALIGGISGAVVGGLAGAVVGGIHGLGTKNDVQHSGSFGASHGAMGAKIPFIVVRRPVQKKVYNYSLSYGYPAHKMVYIGNCEGYLRVREVRVMSTTATNIEKDMIVAALKEGVYVH